MRKWAPLLGADATCAQRKSCVCLTGRVRFFIAHQSHQILAGFRATRLEYFTSKRKRAFFTIARVRVPRKLAVFFYFWMRVSWILRAGSAFEGHMFLCGWDHTSTGAFPCLFAVGTFLIKLALSWFILPRFFLQQRRSLHAVIIILLSDIAGAWGSGET